jgi:site-specific DNA-methyltransferase (cytosine-N4-specific)
VSLVESQQIVQEANTNDTETNNVAYNTDYGVMINSTIEDALASSYFSSIRGNVNTIITSPPFPLVKKKKYGNETGETYLKWLEALAPRLADMLTPDGSIVIEIGNAWVKGIPEMSTLPLEALLAFKKAANLHLCQHIICHNTARLPSPAQWVTIERTRLKDSFTHVWWLSKTPNPKADNRKILTPYSKRMKSLIERKKYNAGKRPSGHKVSPNGFLKDHGGAIPPSVLHASDEAKIPESLLQFANTGWDANYRQFCQDKGIDAHPARMQADLVGFFINFLTEAGDLVMDPFAGSNTTGSVAETLGRKWISIEANADFTRGSQGRFPLCHVQ